MSVLSFETEDEAIDRANNTQFGLSGAVFTKDFSRAHRVANRLQAGSVWINDYNVTPPEVPFGGYKQSGLGRENGLQAMQYCTQVKTICANLGDVPKTFRSVPGVPLIGVREPLDVSFSAKMMSQTAMQTEPNRDTLR